MNTKEKKLAIIGTVILLGAAVFGTGYSLRPSRAAVSATIQQARFAARVAPAIARAEPDINADVDPATVELVAQNDSGGNASAGDTNQKQTQIRVGTIVSMNGELFILRDDDNNTWYHLDDQHAAGSFLGKKVQVKGPVDPATDVIHVESIEQAKA